MHTGWNNSILSSLLSIQSARTSPIPMTATVIDNQHRSTNYQTVRLKTGNYSEVSSLLLLQHCHHQLCCWTPQMKLASASQETTVLVAMTQAMETEDKCFTDDRKFNGHFSSDKNKLMTDGLPWSHIKSSESYPVSFTHTHTVTHIIMWCNAWAAL